MIFYKVVQAFYNTNNNMHGCSLINELNVNLNKDFPLKELLLKFHCINN